MTREKCPFPGSLSVLRCTGVVNRNRLGRPSVLHLRLSSASWLNAECLLHINVKKLNSLNMVLEAKSHV